MDTTRYRTRPRGDDVQLVYRDTNGVDHVVHKWTDTGCAGAAGPSLSDLLTKANRHAHDRRVGENLEQYGVTRPPQQIPRSGWGR